LLEADQGIAHDRLALDRDNQKACLRAEPLQVERAPTLPREFVVIG
jgi:hypothetical protein